LGFKHVEIHKLLLRVIINPEEIEFLDFIKMPSVYKKDMTYVFNIRKITQ